MKNIKVNDVILNLIYHIKQHEQEVSLKVPC